MLEKVELSELRELVEHEQNAAARALVLGGHLCQALQDLVEHQAQQSLEA